ncbi:hypothetical protein V8E54_000214 [Elaphomyces granulatus]
MSSPAKRRKTTPTTDASIDAPKETVTHNVQTPVTYRNSFQSPTKASLARYHPEILARALSRSPTRSSLGPTAETSQEEKRHETEERVFRLRDRKALRPSPAASKSPGSSILSPTRRSSGIEAFAARLHRASKRIGPSHQAASEVQAVPENDGPEGQLASELGSATRDPEAQDIPESSLLQEEGEPDLPPTPAQLGLGTQLDRPKDLLSSPSRHYEKRRGHELESSPLEPNNVQPLVEENNNLDDVPEAVKKKRVVKRDLSAKLRQLKNDIAQLESWAQRSERPDDHSKPDAESVNKLISILTASDTSHVVSSAPQSPPPLSCLISTLLPFSTNALPRDVRQSSPDPKNPFALKELADPKPYLTVFAPLVLYKYSTKISASNSEAGMGLTETHDLTLSAPSPFPRNIYTIPLTFKTDLGTQSIKSVSISTDSSALHSKVPSQLLSWINSRLSSPLTRLDVSGLCWGISRYWEAALLRARIWTKLQRKYAVLIADLKNLPEEKLNRYRIEAEENIYESMSRLSKADICAWAPHMERVMMLFSHGGKRDSKLLLSCTLTLDAWTGEPQLKPEISVTVPGASESAGAKVEREAKRLFCGFLKDGRGNRKGLFAGDMIDGDAIVRATEGVLGILFGSEIFQTQNADTQQIQNKDVRENGT